MPPMPEPPQPPPLPPQPSMTLRATKPKTLRKPPVLGEPTSVPAGIVSDDARRNKGTCRPVITTSAVVGLYELNPERCAERRPDAHTGSSWEFEPHLFRLRPDRS